VVRRLAGHKSSILGGLRSAAGMAANDKNKERFADASKL
jgi:hypothetical protein